MTTRHTLRAKILEIVPADRYVPASDIVETLADLPAKAVWAEIVMLAMDGEIRAEHPGTYDGRAMVRRTLDRAGRT